MSNTDTYEQVQSPLGNPLLITSEAADYLRCSASLLNKMRMAGLGPRFVRVGSRVRYRVSDLVEYVERETV
jgi:hypothetical protein